MARVVFDDYSNRVINVVKAKYNLKDKSEALNKFIHLCGKEVLDMNDIEMDAKEEYIKKLDQIEANHFKKYGYRHTSIEELRKEIEGK